MGRERALRQGILIDEAIEELCECTALCGRAPRAGTVGEALHPLGGKALHPCAQRRLGQGQRVGDDLQVRPMTTSRTAWTRQQYTGLFGLCHEGIGGRQSVLRQAASGSNGHLAPGTWSVSNISAALLKNFEDFCALSLSINAQSVLC
jgi:hypothetical protein